MKFNKCALLLLMLSLGNIVVGMDGPPPPPDIEEMGKNPPKKIETTKEEESKLTGTKKPTKESSVKVDLNDLKKNVEDIIKNKGVPSMIQKGRLATFASIGGGVSLDDVKVNGDWTTVEKTWKEFLTKLEAQIKGDKTSTTGPKMPPKLPPKQSKDLDMTPLARALDEIKGA